MGGFFFLSQFLFFFDDNRWMEVKDFWKPAEAQSRQSWSARENGESKVIYIYVLAGYVGKS